ncbi:MAG: pitrilysin family protein [Bryobacteraceae bacterium]
MSLIAGLLLAAAAYSQSLPQGVQLVTRVEGITEYSLPNGLHFLLFPDASQPKVTVNIIYLVGSRFEGYGETGMAHLLEHLNFIQTRTRDNIKKEITDHGAQFNGNTDYDRTSYFETVNSTDENLKWALELEADRMIHTRIEKALLDKEMTVVRNEFEMGENDPGNILSERVVESAYIWHAYGHPVIGSKSDIEKVPIENLAAFYRKYYQPDNALLVVAGKFDEAKALAWIVEDFGKIPRPERKLEATYTVEPAQDGERSVMLRRVGDTQYVMALYHTPAATHPDDAAVQVLAGVLGDTPSGRLYKALVDNKKAVQANMASAEQHDPGFIMATVQLQPNQSIDEARKILLDTVEGFVKEPPSKEEVDRVKTRLLKNIELAMANSQYVAMMLTEDAAQGDWRMLFLGRDRIKQVTPDDVLRVAKAYLKESNRTLGEFIPTKAPDRAEIPTTPELATTFKDFKGGEAAAQGEVFDPSNANIDSRVTRGKMANGLKVTLLPKKNRGGTVVANLIVRFGDEKSLFGKPAVAQLVGAVLMRGTKNKSRQQIQDEMDKLKAQISVSGGVNNASADVQTVEANLPGALKLVAEILREPSFPEAEFEQVRQQLIANIEEGRSEPQVLAGQGFERRINSIYPRGDVRYVGTVDEEIEDLKKVTLDEAKKFYQQFYGASEGEFTVVGQFDQAGIQKLGEELFGNWKVAAPYARILSPYRKIEPENVKIETPDKQNALSVAGQMFKMSDEDADYPATIMANYILGGTFSARLVTRIRHKEGLSYGVGSQISVPTKDDGATFLAYAISNPENAPKVEASFMDEVALTIKGGFTPEELAAGKKAWAEERMVGRSQDGSLAGLLAARARWGRTMQFDQDLESKVAALTLDQVSAALGKAINAARLIYVKAGDFKKAGAYQ